MKIRNLVKRVGTAVLAGSLVFGMAAEVMAAAETAKEGVWIKKFLEELGVVPTSQGPLELF